MSKEIFNPNPEFALNAAIGSMDTCSMLTQQGHRRL